VQRAFMAVGGGTVCEDAKRWVGVGLGRRVVFNFAALVLTSGTCIDWRRINTTVAYPPELYDLINAMLTLGGADRISAQKALEHECFDCLRPVPSL